MANGILLEAADDLGAALRRHREASGRSLRDLADSTKLGVRTFEALERNQVEKLPPGIFRRAVVRAYAEEVGLDPEQALRVFLARHPDKLPPPGPHVGPVADTPSSSTTNWSAVHGGLLVGVMAIVIALAVWWWTGRPTKPASRPGPSAAISLAEDGAVPRGRGI